MNRKFTTLVAVLIVVTMALPVSADDVSYHQESKSYQVYLGVVPAGLLKKAPSLVDNDKQLHGGTERQSPTAQHVMVTIFRNSDDSRVLNATVIAEIKQKKLFGGVDVTKPLEKMVTSGKTAYGNFFDMPNTGEYEFEVKIYEPHKNGNEEVSFIYKQY